MILGFSNGIQFRQVFALKRLGLLSFGTLLTHLMVIRSIYTAHFTGYFRTHIVFLRSFGEFDGSWTGTYTISNEDFPFFGKINCPL